MSVLLNPYRHGVAYDADALAYFAAMSVQPDDTRKGLLNTLIAGIKSDGDWTGLDWFCILAAHDSQAARLNARNPAKSCTATNSPTFTTDRGYTGDGSTSYLDLGEALNAAGNAYALNSGAAGVWANQQAATAITRHLGVTSGSNVMITARANAGNETFQANDGTADTSQANPGTRTGHRALSRTGSGIKRAFFNGVRVADLTTASTSVPTANVCVLRSATVYTADRIAAFYTGSGLSDAALGRLHSRLSTFLTTIGAN